MTETFYIVALLWSLERAMALAQAKKPAVRDGLVLGLSLGLSLLWIGAWGCQRAT